MLAQDPWTSGTIGDPNRLIPAVIQNVESKQVLMLGYFNQASYQETLKSGKVTFYSRSRERLWTKGESSGNYLELVELFLDCDQDTFLVKVRPHGPTCHTGDWTCFSEERPPSESSGGFGFLRDLEMTIEERIKNAQKTDSYVAKLCSGGLDRVAQKVGEEAVETLIASKNDHTDALINEASDLVFHLMILLKFRDQSFSKVVDCLRLRSRS